jgi:hypothetical protein
MEELDAATEQQYPSALGGFTSMRDSQGTSMITLTNPEPLLSEIEVNLKGLVEMPDGTIVKTGEPLMNDQGVTSIMSMVRGTLNQNTILSNINDKEVKGIISHLAYAVMKDLMLNRKKWDIKTGEDRTRIVQIIITPVYLCLKRSFEQGEKNFWKGSVSEIIQHNQQRKDQGVWSKLNPFGR